MNPAASRVAIAAPANFGLSFDECGVGDRETTRMVLINKSSMVRKEMALRCARLVTREALVACGVAARAGVAHRAVSSTTDQQKASSSTAAHRHVSEVIVSSATYCMPQPRELGRLWGFAGVERLQASGFAGVLVRELSSSTDASLLGDDGFDPFVTHHNADDTDRADQMVRDYVKRRLASGDNDKLRESFADGVLNSYRVLNAKTAEKARTERRRPDATFAKKADEFLAFVENAYSQDPSLSPTSKSYAMVMDAYAKMGDPEGAEAVLLRLEKLWRSGNKEVKPDKILYNSVIDAWAKSGRREAPMRAEAILQHMEQLNKQGHKGVRPNVICYNSVINAWAKSREKGAAERAEAILNHMIKLQEGGREECQPNTRSFNSAIDAWAKSRDADAPRRAEALLEKMEQLNQQGHEEIRPGTISYNSVINAWAKSREKGAAQRAETILNHMIKLQEGGREECRPNTRSFNTAIDAWAKSREKGAAQRAEAILNKMLNLHGGGREDCCPTAISFTSVIDAWAKSGDAKAYDNAMRIFNLMQSMKDKGHSDIEAGISAYGALMNALATSSISDKAPRAYNMLLELEKRSKAGEANLAPDTQSYGTVLKACARASLGKSLKRKDEALRIALMTFEKLRNNPDVTTDPYKYAPLFSIIDNTTKGTQYEKLTREVFRLCCEDGVLNDKQLEKLHRFAPKEVFRKLVGTNDTVTVRDLPPKWSRNVR